MILRTIEFRLYPNAEQERTLSDWLRRCCWTYNQALEHRIKSYRRRQKPVGLYDQYNLLTIWRERIERLRLVPTEFLRGAMRRVDRGMKTFFHRIKTGDKKVGFPRFRPHQRYNSLECLGEANYVGTGTIRIPKLGTIRARGQFGVERKQKLLRVIRRASGWYAQVLIEQPKPEPISPTGEECGIDLGLESFLTTDAGEKIGNPRHLRQAEKKLRRSHKRLSRCQKGSNRHEQAKGRVRRLYEEVARKRKGFCHRISREVVNRYDRISIEDLRIKHLVTSRLAKHIFDACWATFIFYLTFKAECAGRLLVKVNPRGTSQECPRCGTVAQKELSERVHCCKACGFRCHRDQASAMVIRQRAFRPVRGDPLRPIEAGSMNREGTW